MAITRRGFLKKSATAIAGVTLLGQSPIIISKSNPQRKNLTDFFRDYYGYSIDREDRNVAYWETHCHTNKSLLSRGGQLMYGTTANSIAEAVKYARDKQKLDAVTFTDDSGLYDGCWRADMNELRDRHNDETGQNGNPLIIYPGYEYKNTAGASGDSFLHLLLAAFGDEDAIRRVMGSKKGHGHFTVHYADFDLLPDNSISPFFLAPNPSYAKTSRDMWNKLNHLRPQYHSGMPQVLTIPHSSGMTGTARSINQSGGKEDHRLDPNFMDEDFFKVIDIGGGWEWEEGRTPNGVPTYEGEVLPPVLSEVGDSLRIRSIIYDWWNQFGDSRYKIGIVGGTDNQTGHPGKRETDYGMLGEKSTAITACVVPQKTRAEIWKAAHEKRTMAMSCSPESDSDPRRDPAFLSAETAYNVLFMGEHGANHDGQTLARVLATPETERIDLILDGGVVATSQSNYLEQLVNLGQPVTRHSLYAKAYSAEKGELKITVPSPIYFGKPSTRGVFNQEIYDTTFRPSPFPLLQMLFGILQQFFSTIRI